MNVLNAPDLYTLNGNSKFYVYSTKINSIMALNIA